MLEVIIYHMFVDTLASSRERSQTCAQHRLILDRLGQHQHLHRLLFQWPAHSLMIFFENVQKYMLPAEGLGRHAMCKALSQWHMLCLITLCTLGV